MSALLEPPLLRRWLRRSTLATLAYGLLLLGAAGRLDWLWGWVLLGVLLLVLLAHPLLVGRANPAALAAREQGMWAAGVKRWDKPITAFAGMGMLLIWLVAGLDVRWGWSPPLPLAVHLAGLALTVLGHAGFLWAMAVNPFFAQGVRVQSERGHHVISRGPYRWLRHPGYAATIVAHLATPPLLGSLYAWLPAAALAALFVLRTALEDRTLCAELPGYRSYARRTRARLLPWLW